jgi:hypothetical protein
MLMTLMRALQGVMQTESALLSGMRLERLRALQAERVALAQSYARALQRLRKRPEVLATLDGEGRGLLDCAMRELQAEVRRHAERLVEARTVAEDVVRAIGESLGSPDVGRGAASRPAGKARGGRVIVVAFDRSRAERADGTDEACPAKQLGNDA